MSYKLQSCCQGRWQTFLEDSLAYCQGFLDARKNYAPRPAYRIVDQDGKVVDETEARDDVNIGMIAGWPTAEQYEQAAREALERAEAIRKQKGKKA